MFRLWDLVLVSYFAMDPKNASSRGPLRAKKIHTKSTSLSVNKKAMQGIALTQPWAVEVDFVSYLPIRNQLLTLTWRTNECGGRKWGLLRANPVDKNRCINALIVISYRFLSIGSVYEGFWNHSRAWRIGPRRPWSGFIRLWSSNSSLDEKPWVLLRFKTPFWRGFWTQFGIQNRRKIHCDIKIEFDTITELAKPPFL